MKTELKIYPIGQDGVAAFAGQELQKYLEKMTGCPVTVIPQAAFCADLQGGIWLGLAGDIPDSPLLETASAMDDAVAAQVNGGEGWIAGVNPRSLLLAVYRCLHELGCRWLRPGPEGESIPRRETGEINVQLNEKPAYRHRGICIEGAVSLENVLEVVDWAPKLGLTAYFHQFREGHTFFDRWYSHRGNPLKTPEICTPEQAQEYTRIIETELARRGMLYHAVGHGWTCEAYGIPGLGWDPVIQDWPDEVLAVLAEVNGKRVMWHDIPMITSLCFSQPGVREKVIACVADYLSEHGNIDALHLWLDDGFNNKCECPECRAMLPSDYYILLLNELDQEMTRRGLVEKIVFLCYADMLWPPESARLANPDRFIFMFAPITRSYRQPLFPENIQYPIPAFDRNKLVFSNNNDEQLAFLRGWQQVFSGDSFIFEYHLIQGGGYTLDPEPTFLAHLLWEDIRNLRALKLNGYISCQYLRNFFPTGLGMYVLGRTLWDDTLSFDSLLADHFAASFGADWERAVNYLQSFSALQDVVPLREKDKPVDPNAQEKLAEGLAVVDAFAPVIERNLAVENPTQARSWFYLQAHARIMRGTLKMLSARAQGNHAAELELWQALKNLVCQLEDEIQPVFDLYGFVSAHESALEI
jgi:hypothetical protein